MIPDFTTVSLTPDTDGRTSVDSGTRADPGAWADQVVAEALRRGVWVYPAGDGNAPDALLIGPPFTITEAEMDVVVAVVGESISAVCGD